MCNLWQTFMGMSMGKFCGYGIILMGMKFWLWKNFVGYVMFDPGKFCGYDFGYVGVFAVVHGHGHVGIFSMAWLWKKFGSCVWTCQKF